MPNRSGIEALLTSCETETVDIAAKSFQPSESDQLPCTPSRTDTRTALVNGVHHVVVPVVKVTG